MKKNLIALYLLVILAVFFTSTHAYASNDIDVPFINKKPSIKKLLPSKNETNKVVKKFIHSMLLVGGSVIVVVLFALIYKNSKRNKKQEINYDINKNLNSPENVDTAIKFFIEKF